MNTTPETPNTNPETMNAEPEPTEPDAAELDARAALGIYNEPGRSVPELVRDLASLATALTIARPTADQPGPLDALWWGRAVNRQARRAVAASQRAQAYAAALGRVGDVIASLRDEMRDLRQAADDAIPFGDPEAPDETTIASWRKKAADLEAVILSLETAAHVPPGEVGR